MGGPKTGEQRPAFAAAGGQLPPGGSTMTTTDFSTYGLSIMPTGIQGLQSTIVFAATPNGESASTATPSISKVWRAPYITIVATARLRMSPKSPASRRFGAAA